MGYYSEVVFKNIKILKDKIGEFNKEIKALKISKNAPEWVSEFGDIKANNDGSITLEYDYGKFYDDENFAKFLSRFVNSGEIIFYGEDGTIWGYRFENDKILKLETMLVERGVLK